MKLRILSDLHLEGDQSFVYEYQGEDVVVLAGDISSRIPLYENFIANITVPIVCVPGNHEFYKHTFDTHLKALIDVGYIYNEIKVIDGVHFICGTGWSDFTLKGNLSSDRYEFIASQYINDFRLITKEAKIGIGSSKTYHRNWHTRDCALEHAKYLIFLEDALDATEGKKRVVVSHFLPLGNCIHEKYLGSELSPYFASDLSALVTKANCLWVHGHTHSNVDITYNNTRIICNPKGYVSHSNGNENQEFNKNLVIEI